MRFETLLRLIADTAPVRAGEVNRPLRQVDQNVRYLLDLINAASLGSTIYAHRQPVEAEAAVGMAVYLDPVSRQFVRALATADVDQVTGAVTTAASAQVWGIVAAKINATLADVLLYGYAAVDVSAAVTGDPAAGVYYLSGVTPGKLTLQKPPVSVAVLRRTPDGSVFVTPQFVDVLDRHTHYKFALTCRPAGGTTPPDSGGRHVVTDPDPLLPGWLPAGHASFQGKAPAGAVFGYNLAAQPALANAWPPIPLGQADLEWNKGLSADVGATGVPAGLVTFTRDGIWWMSDCHGDVPWPVSLTTGGSASASDSTSASAGACPRPLDMTLTLYFTRVNFATDAAVVLSLHSGDARIKVNCYGDPTRAASTGHLQIDLDLNLVVKDDQPGYLALKDFDPATTSFARGPVAEGLYALSGNVNLTGPVSGTRTINGVDRRLYHGPIGVSVDPADTKELDVQLVRLDGAEEAWYGDPPVMYLEFAAGEARAYRARFEVPADLAVPTPKLKLRLAVLGRAAGTLPQLTFTGRIAGRPPAGLDTPVDLPGDGAEFSITCVTVAALDSNNQYVEAESTGFSVAPGDTVYVYVARTADDGYPSAVGVLRQTGVVYSGP